MKAFLPSIAKRGLIWICLLFASVSILVSKSLLFAAVEPVAYDLFAGQHFYAGTVDVWNDDEHLYVKYVTTGGWHLAETHMHFATSLDGIPQTTKGNPIPGQFDYKTEHSPKVVEFLYEADLNDLEPGDMLYFACHADVELLDLDGNTIQEEGAWAGNEPFPGKNWATYFTFEVQAWDTVPPSLDITNPLDNSVITNTTPYITINFSDDDTGVNLSTLQILIDGEDYTSDFTVSEASAKNRMADLLSLGSHAISTSISDNAGNKTTTECNFTCTTSTEPIRYIFSAKNNQWIHASPGDGTCTEYLNSEDLGILDSADLVALSKVLPGGKIYFSLYDQNGILQSPANGSNELYFDNEQMGLGTSDQVFAGHIGPDGSAYFAAEGQPDIWQSDGNYASSFFKQSNQLGIQDSSQISCLHIGYDGTIYFCHAEGQGIFESLGDGTNSQFLTATDLGVPGSEIDAFAILPETNPPTVTITNPIDGAFLYTTTPNITVGFQDIESGIDPTTFYAEINGEDMSSAFAVTETGATYQVPGGSPLPVGENSILVRIKDRTGNEASTTSNFTIGILRAIPGANPTSGPAPLTVRFTTDGEDPAGTIIIFRWDFNGDGTWDTYDTVARDYNRTYNTPGTYSPKLFVQSSTGQTATASLTITVQNNPPVATANVVPSNGEIPLAVNMVGSGSDVDGTITLFEWDFEGDGVFDWSSTTTGNTTFTYTTEGTYNAVFRVTDDNGLTDTAIATTTVVRAGPPGSPTAVASASPTVGNAPLSVNFSASGSFDPEGSLVLYEWDFENDGTYDFSSPTTGNTNHTFTEAGTHIALLRVTDAEGLIGIDQVLITVNIQTSLSIAKNTVGYLNPIDVEPTGTNVNTSISADSQISIIIKDEGGNIVRTLVNNEFRTRGSYTDYWDCRDDQGFVVNDGVHYAILQYIVDGIVETLDLTYSTGGARYSFPTGGGCNRRDVMPKRTFSPYDDDFSPITFRLCQASEVTVFIGPLWSGGSATRIRTIVNRKPLPAGSHTVYWDGLDDQGNIAHPPPGDSLILGMWRYTLPNNAIYMTGGRPVISNVTSDPNYFSPFSNTCLDNGDAIKVTYTVSEDVDLVELRVINLDNKNTVRVIKQFNILAGENYIFWNGQNSNGDFVDAGDYQLALVATDGEGNDSMMTTANLARVAY